MEYTKIRVKKGKRDTYRYRRKLKALGLTYSEYSKEFETTVEDTRQGKKQFNKIENFCYRKGLKFIAANERYTRGNGYRKEYFEKHSPDLSERYFCIYCGRLLKKEDVQIDHIIPVAKASKNTRVQWMLKLHGCETVNDMRNLGASCGRCNHLKKDKMGFWIARGYIGKSRIFQFARLAARIILLTTAAIIIIKIVNGNGEMIDGVLDTYRKFVFGIMSVSGIR